MEKKWYRTVPGNSIDESALVVSESNLTPDDYKQLERGIILDKWDPQTWFQSEKYDGPPDDYVLSILDIHITSGRLKTALELAGIVTAQYLPARLLHVDGVEVPGYYVINILNIIPCLDMNKSDYTFDEENPGKILFCLDMVLKENCIPSNIDIFRVAEWPTIVIVSEKFKEVIIRGGFTGIEFRKMPLSQIEY